MISLILTQSENVSNKTLLSVNSTYSSLSTSTTENKENFKTALGLSLAILASLSFAISTIFLKKLKINKISNTVILNYSSYVGIPLALLISVVIRLVDDDKAEKPIERILDDKWKILWQCVFISLSGLSTILTQFFLNAAVKYEDPAKVALVRMSDLIIIFFLQRLVFGIDPNLISKIGALLLFLSTFMVIFYKILNEKYGKNENVSESKLRKCFFYQF